MPFLASVKSFFAELKRRLVNREVRTGLKSEEETWLLEGDWMACQSSNVDLAKYEWEEGRLWIQYKDGVVWSYAIPFNLAASFYRAGSKGIWTWDHLRVRGPGNAHRHQVDARMERFH